MSSARTVLAIMHPDPALVERVQASSHGRTLDEIVEGVLRDANASEADRAKARELLAWANGTAADALMRGAKKGR